MSGYNGWTNYATWRVSMEILDDVPGIADGLTFDSVRGLADYLKEYTDQAVMGDCDEVRATDFKAAYALSFIESVNYYEIADNAVDDFPELLGAIHEQSERCSECGGPIEDGGDGYDGMCADCADAAEALAS
jgi:hypothetical protein